MLSQAILGMWLFTSLIYQGQSMPLPNPDLKIYYEFFADGTNTLYYHRKGEEGFCERRATFEFNNEQIAQEVVWVNPDNAIWCGQDTDMQLGYRSWNKARLVNQELHLSLPMGEEEIIYIWSKVPSRDSSLPTNL